MAIIDEWQDALELAEALVADSLTYNDEKVLAGLGTDTPLASWSTELRHTFSRFKTRVASGLVAEGVFEEAVVNTLTKLAKKKKLQLSDDLPGDVARALGTKPSGSTSLASSMARAATSAAAQQPPAASPAVALPSAAPEPALPRTVTVRGLGGPGVLELEEDCFKYVPEGREHAPEEHSYSDVTEIRWIRNADGVELRVLEGPTDNTWIVRNAKEAAAIASRIIPPLFE